MVLPNFLVIGAAKAGTTSLYNYLNQHPEIYMSPAKEPRYFLLENEDITFQGPGDLEILQSMGFDVTDLDAYQELFDNAQDKTAIGEATALYLYSAKACQRIKRHIPNAKLIAILRNPVERAYSNYLHLLYTGRETTPDFYRAFQSEESRIDNNWEPFWHYKQQGFYCAQLSRYFEEFHRNQIKICLYKDLKQRPSTLAKEIFRFLDVDDQFCPDVTTRHNSSDSKKSRASNRKHEVLLKQLRVLKPITGKLFSDGLHRQISQSVGTVIRQKVSFKTPPLTAEVRRNLLSIYREDILKLQDLIQRDLSDWLVS